MTQRKWQTPVVVIADDFTGANDVGSGLARAGARVNVLFDSGPEADRDAADVWVIGTDSRALNAEQAADRVRDVLAHWPQALSDGWLFKKIDSTLRGNLGAETEAALLGSGAEVALVVPAVPRLGRVTRDGQCYIHGLLLTETEFASDPKTPVVSANVAARLAEQSNLPTEMLSLAQVRSADLAMQIQQLVAEGRRLLVADAENDDDLQRVVLAAARLPQRPLLVGAAGLSDALSDMLCECPVRPMLAVVGSMSEISQRQIVRLQQQRSVTLVDIDISGLFASPAWPQREAWHLTIVKALQEGRHCVIRTCQDSSQRASIAALCEQYQLSRAELGEQICALLAGLIREVLESAQPAGLYLSGGDVAIAVSRGLGASGFQIEGQIAGCVPWGRLLNVTNSLLVMTRAGGFGDDNTLLEVIRFIEEKSSE